MNICEDPLKIFFFFAEWLREYEDIQLAYIDVVLNDIPNLPID